MSVPSGSAPAASQGGLFQLEWSGLRNPERIDRLLLVVAIAVLVGILQGYAVSQEGLRHQVDLHWQRGMSFMKIGVRWFQEAVANAGRTLLDWIPIPQKKLEPCVPSRAVARWKKGKRSGGVMKASGRCCP